MIDCWICVDCVYFIECEASARCSYVFERFENCLTGQHCKDFCYEELPKEDDKNADS